MPCVRPYLNPLPTGLSTASCTAIFHRVTHLLYFWFAPRRLLGGTAFLPRCGTRLPNAAPCIPQPPLSARIIPTTPIMRFVARRGSLHTCASRDYLHNHFPPTPTVTPLPSCRCVNRGAAFRCWLVRTHLGRLRTPRTTTYMPIHLPCPAPRPYTHAHTCLPCPRIPTPPHAHRGVEPRTGAGSPRVPSGRRHVVCHWCWFRCLSACLFVCLYYPPHIPFSRRLLDSATATIWSAVASDALLFIEMTCWPPAALSIFCHHLTHDITTGFLCA